MHNAAPINKPTPAASSSAANYSPTVQGLANEFNSMQGDVVSLKDTINNFASMIQHALSQPQQSPTNTNQ